MKAIMVMYDSLRRDLLESYGCDWTKTPNFKRLADLSVQFENCYVGSMPCMPARRELHTGRINFFHRSWGPMEPFDDSMPEILKKGGVYTHLVSDHQHYWEDGGCTYHNRYSSWEISRGQEGDLWKADLSYRYDRGTVFKNKEVMLSYPPYRRMMAQDAVNRSYMDTEEKTSQAVTFHQGLEFIEKNHGEDNWFLQIETFDPHEPFYSLMEDKALYPHTFLGDAAEEADWPPYAAVAEDEKQQEQRSQIPKHSLHHVIPLQNGNHQFQLIILPVGHTESGTHDTYRFVFILQFDINRSIIEHLSVMPPFLFGYRGELIERHQRDFRFEYRGVVKRTLHQYLTVILQRIVRLIHHLVNDCVIEQHTPHRHQQKQQQCKFAVGVAQQLHSSESL